MPRTNRNLTEKITIQITRPMLADLQNVAAKSSKPLAEIIRQAIRNALDDTDLTLGTKRRFDRRLQKRIDEMEQNLKEPGAGTGASGGAVGTRPAGGIGQTGVPRESGF